MERPRRSKLLRSRRRFTQLWLGTAVLWLALVISLTNRSHTSPYRARPSAPVDDRAVPSVRVILIGDAGLALSGSKVLRAAADLSTRPAGRTAVVYLGDNVYPSGLPPAGDPYRAHAEATLLAQLRAFDASGAQVYFTPGNHDWAEGSPDGPSAVLRQRDFIRRHGVQRAALLPGDGGPGPACVDEAEVRLVFVDTQWFLQEQGRPDASLDSVREQLAACLRHSPALFLTHHPSRSHGVHGNHFNWQDHLFPLTRLSSRAYLPLPVIGSLYPLVRSLGVSTQDLPHEANLRMVEELGSVLKAAPPLAWAAGHEHSLQVLDGAPYANFALVSGAGSKTGAVTDEADTLFAHEALGFMEIRFFDGRAPVLVVHSETDSGVHPTFRHVLGGGPGTGLPG
jgi:hypothetical protein